MRYTESWGHLFPHMLRVRFVLRGVLELLVDILVIKSREARFADLNMFPISISLFRTGVLSYGGLRSCTLPVRLHSLS